MEEEVKQDTSETETQEIIKKEVMQFVRAYQILGLLLDFSIFICRNKFRADRSVYYIK